MTDLTIGTAGLTALLGYGVVFMGLIFLMIVIMILGGIMGKKAKKAAAETAQTEEKCEGAVSGEAPGTAGELKLYDTDPRDAAMIMAIVADTLGKPLNELRFKSIREVKE